MLNTYWDNIKNDNLLAGQEQLDAELIYDTKFLYSKKSFPQRRSRLRLRYGFGKHFFPFFKISNELSVLADLRTDGVPKAQIRDIECEATQPIEKAEQEKQEAGLTYVTNLFPYFLNPLFPCKRSAFTLAEGRLAWQTQSALTQTDVNRHKSTGTNSCNHLIVTT